MTLARAVMSSVVYFGPLRHVLPGAVESKGYACVCMRLLRALQSMCEMFTLTALTHFTFHFCCVFAAMACIETRMCYTVVD